MFGTLELGLEEAAAIDPHTLSAQELCDAVVELSTLRARLDALEAKVVGAFDAQRAWCSSGAKSAAAWLATITRDPKADTSLRVRLGRQVSALPVAAAAWQHGEIGTAQFRLLANARNARTADDLTRDEEMLVDQAATLGFADFTRTMDYWRLHADPDGADDEAMARRARRRVELVQTMSGMWTGTTLLDPISGEIVAGELARREQELFEADWAEATERLGREPLVSELTRTADQRRADALVEMATRSATPQKGARPRPLFSVVLGNEAFSHLL